MTLPVGITTCTATIGAGYTFLGEEAVISGTVVADRSVVWAATGAPIFKTESVVTPSSPGGQASFVVPHVDQDGFVDGAGNDITGWYYTFSGRATFEGNRVEAITKRFQVVVGQTTVDLDLVPDGPVIPGVTTPTAAVTSVNGETGAVTVAGGLDDSDIAALVADPDSDTGGAVVGLVAAGAGYRRLNLVFDGDSNFAGGNGLVPLKYRIHTQTAEGMANTTARNFGVSGQTITAMTADAVAQIDTLIDADPSVLNVLVVGGGGNDLDEGGRPSAATVYARKQAYHTARRAAGWKTIECVVLPRSLAAGHVGYETKRLALNASIRAGWATYADALIDTDTDSGLATEAATADERLWPDGLHISSVGVSRVVDLIKPEVAALGGLTGQRQPQNRIPSGSIWIGAGDFEPVNGTPPTVGEAPTSSWMWPDADRGYIAASVQIPREWKRLRIYVYWSPYGSDGNVSHFVTMMPLTPGGDWYQPSSGTAGNGAVGMGINKVVRSELGGRPVLSTNDAVAWSVAYKRNSGDAGDTHTNSMLFLGVELVDHPLDGE